MNEENNNFDEDSFDVIETLDDDIEQLPVDDKEDFGEKEHNAAKDENGHYNKNYYAKRQAELDKKVKDAKDEKERNWKMNKGSENENVKADGSNTHNKNLLEKAKDRVNYANAKRESLDNKMAAISDKAYKSTHPGEMLKEKANELKDKAKEKAKKRAKETTKKVRKAALNFFSTPQGMLLLMIVAIVIFVIFIILIFFGSSSHGGNNYIGLYGYEYYEACKDVSKDGVKMSIEEYIQGVLAAEVGGFPIETQKAIAIAARTYVIQNGTKVGDDIDTCYYNADKVQQAFNASIINERSIQAANETRGLIVTINDELRGNYDASCVYTASDAAALDPSGTYISSHYYIRFGKWTLGGVHFQEIDKDKVNLPFNGQSLSTYANRAETIGPCAGNHGGGMSQNGAAYLEYYNNYTWQDIIDFYYDGQEVIKSIYGTFAATDNWTQVINNSAKSSIPTTILRKSLMELLSAREISELNELIKDAVLAAGVGSRNAIIAAGTIPIKYLAENYGVILPYTWGGGRGNSFTSYSTGENIEHETSRYYGVDPYWGSNIIPKNGNLNYGPDCVGWVTWVLHNAGVYFQDWGTSSLLNVMKRYPDSIHPTDGSYIGAPGDILLHKNAHIMMIVGVDETSGYYYVSHAEGNNYGVNISKKTIIMNNPDVVVIDMTTYLEANTISTYEEDFESGLINF